MGQDVCVTSSFSKYHCATMPRLITSPCISRGLVLTAAHVRVKAARVQRLLWFTQVSAQRRLFLLLDKRNNASTFSNNSRPAACWWWWQRQLGDCWWQRVRMRSNCLSRQSVRLPSASLAHKWACPSVHYRRRNAMTAVHNRAWNRRRPPRLSSFPQTICVRAKASPSYAFLPLSTYPPTLLPMSSLIGKRREKESRVRARGLTLSLAYGLVVANLFPASFLPSFPAQAHVKNDYNVYCDSIPTYPLHNHVSMVTLANVINNMSIKARRKRCYVLPTFMTVLTCIMRQLALGFWLLTDHSRLLLLLLYRPSIQQLRLSVCKISQK